MFDKIEVTGWQIPFFMIGYIFGSLFYGLKSGFMVGYVNSSPDVREKP